MSIVIGVVKPREQQKGAVMSLLQIIGTYELGLEVFKHLHLNDIDACRLVCRGMQYFVDNVVWQCRSFVPRLNLEYRRERWMSGKPLASIPIDSTCEVDTSHSLREVFVIHERLVIVIKASSEEQKRFVLTFDNEGNKLRSFSFEGRVRFSQRTNTSLLMITDGGCPDILWNCVDLALFHIYTKKDTLIELGSGNGMFFWVFKNLWKAAYSIDMRHPTCIYYVIQNFNIEPFQTPNHKPSFHFSSKWIILQYHFQDQCILEMFDIKTGKRAHMIPSLDGSRRGHKNVTNYIEPELLTADFAVLCQKQRTLIDLNTFEPISEFAHIQMVNFRTTWSNRTRTFHSVMSNRFAVRIMEKESHRPNLWVIWIGDLVAKTERKFCASSADQIEISQAQIVDDIILILSHHATSIHKGRLVAYDLCETNEERFWKGRVMLGIGRIGSIYQELVGNLGVLVEATEPSKQLNLLRVPFKRNHKMVELDAKQTHYDNCNISLIS